MRIVGNDVWRKSPQVRRAFALHQASAWRIRNVKEKIDIINLE
jgi:hypothetical protein